MASIIQVKGKWRAQVRRKGHAPITKTHRTKTAAEAWARQVEASVEAGEPVVAERTTVGDLIADYRKLRASTRPISDKSTEHYQLLKLDDLLGKKDARKLGNEDLIAFCAERKDDGAGPYTINMDLGKLATAIRYAASARNILLPDSIGLARPLLTHLGLIGGGGHRERRPTQDEMERIDTHLRDGRGVVYAEAVLFAACSAMRRGEICALKAGDIDRKTFVVPVWRKHPRKGKVLERVPLLSQALAIADRQPESADGRLFPIEPGTLSKYFTETCRALSIPDLHLHDMRHEGTSRLFEEGYTIPEAALVTGHKSWQNLKRYTNLKPEGLRRTAKPAPPFDAEGRNAPP